MTKIVIALGLGNFALGALCIQTNSPILAAINFFMAGVNASNAGFRICGLGV